MIVAIKGILESSTLFSAVVEAGGLFYEVNIPLTTAERLPKVGSEVMLYTEAVYREDSQALYGFATKSDRDFFKTIIEKVSGIGPKTALNMMSRMWCKLCKVLLLQAIQRCFQSVKVSARKQQSAWCLSCVVRLCQVQLHKA